MINKFEQIKTQKDIPNFLIENRLNNKICEVGVMKGDGIENLIKCDPRLIIGIDIWEDNNHLPTTNNMNQQVMNYHYRESLKLMIKYPQLKLIKGLSADYVDLFPDNFFDFVYIDADHSYDGVKSDLHNWWSKVSVGGVLGGHDYFKYTSAYTFGVIEAVDEFLIQNNIPMSNFYVTPESFAPSFFLYKDK